MLKFWSVLAILAFAQAKITQENLDRFSEWFGKQFERVHHPGLKLGLRDDGDVGVFAVEDMNIPVCKWVAYFLQEDQVERRVVTIPREAFVTVATIQKQFPQVDLAEHGLDSMEIFAFWFLNGKLNPNFDAGTSLVRELSAATGWKTYIDILPRRIDSPVFFSEDELGLLQGSPIYDKVQEQKAAVRKAWPKVQELAATALPDLQYKDWAWAMAIANQRVKRLKDEHQRPFPALVPFFDSFNHRWYKNPVWGYNQADKFVDVIILEDFLENEEVFIHHGVYCNWEFFLYKAFVPEYNPDNCYPGSAADVIVNPALPNAAERQALLDEAEINVGGLMLLPNSFSKEYELIARISSVDLRDEAEIRRIQAGRAPTPEASLRVYEYIEAYAQERIQAAPLALHDANKLLRLTATPAVRPLFSQRARLALLFRITELELLMDITEAVHQAAENIRRPSKIVEL